jgi:hypothetical protein
MHGTAQLFRSGCINHRFIGRAHMRLPALDLLTVDQMPRVETADDGDASKCFSMYHTGAGVIHYEEEVAAEKHRRG